jgi:hypothetical protein
MKSKRMIALAMVASVIAVLGVTTNGSAYFFNLDNSVKVKPAAARALMQAQNVKPSTGMHTESAGGCLSSEEICIYVKGSGLHVDYVEGFLWPFDGAPRYWCGRSTIYINSEAKGTTNEVCLNEGDAAVSFFPLDRNLPESSIVCVAFTDVSGRPCETIHS